MAVIKANAYGHGLLRAAGGFRAGGRVRACSSSRTRCGCGMRATGSAILLLEGFFEASELPIAAEHGFALVVHTSEQMRDARSLAGPQHRLDVFLKFNTGHEPARASRAGARGRRALHDSMRCAAVGET